MKNLEKKIVCIVSMFIIFCCYIVSFFTVINNKTNPLTSFLYSIYGTTNKIMNKNFIPDSESGVYRLKNGYLSFQKSPVNPEQYENNLVEFNSWLENEGIEFTYVLTAESGDERLGQLPFGVETNYCEETSNKLINILTKNNIEYLNTFEVLINSDKNYYDYFYKTDHHWNEYAGLLVAQSIASHFNKTYGMSLDTTIFNENNYDKIVYKKTFLGSCGKKVCRGYVEPEDFELLLPKFSTKFTCSCKGSTEGSYLETLINSDEINNLYYDTTPYASYLFGDQPIISVKNLNCNNNKRILVLKDSKANIVNAHFASCVEYLDVIDLRHFNGDLRNFIETTNPDVVITIYSPFNPGLFYDFR